MNLNGRFLLAYSALAAAMSRQWRSVQPSWPRSHTAIWRARMVATIVSIVSERPSR